MIIYSRRQVAGCRLQVAVDNKIENFIERIKINRLKKDKKIN
jgi:hypothetical protein